MALFWNYLCPCAYFLLNSLNIVIYILLITAAANFMLAVYSLRYRKSPGIIIYCLLLLAFCFYSFGYAFELQSVDPDSILFWLRVQYIGISFIPSLLIHAVLALYRKNKTS